MIEDFFEFIGVRTIINFPKSCTPIKFSDVKLVNSMGQVVQETKYNNIVSVAELSSGIYFVQLFNENGNLLKVKKFIKE